MNINILFEKVKAGHGLTPDETAEVYEFCEESDRQFSEICHRLFALLDALNAVSPRWKNKIYSLDGLVSADSMSPAEQIKWLAVRRGAQENDCPYPCPGCEATLEADRECPIGELTE